MIDFLLELASIPSRLLNVFIGGSADLTTSAQSHRDGRSIEKWIDALFPWQKAHCKWAWDRELERSRANVAWSERGKE